MTKSDKKKCKDQNEKKYKKQGLKQYLRPKN